MSETTFRVTVDQDEEWGQWRVRVFLPDGIASHYAMVQTKDLDTALRMAVPYMACAAEPDPLAAAVRGFRPRELPDE
mgnify:CR=1 FL=1